MDFWKSEAGSLGGPQRQWRPCSGRGVCRRTGSKTPGVSATCLCVCVESGPSHEGSPFDCRRGWSFKGGVEIEAAV